MLVMRPVRADDLEAVQQLAAASLPGMLSLPDDSSRLREKVLASEVSMAAEVSFSSEETYFFVLEDQSDGKLLGCSGIVASAGYSEPFYSFRNETFVHHSQELSIHNKTHVLSLCHDLTGNSLLTCNHIDPALAQGLYAELNSRGRLLFMAMHPERFADAVLADSVGYSDEQGNVPFWNSLGRHFFDMDYVEAVRLCALKGRTLLVELMPHYPIYVPLLSDAAQEAIGQAHPVEQNAFDILLREGFEADRYIDVFDGGPVLHGRTHMIRSIAQSQQASVIVRPGRESGETYLLACGQLQDFRAVLADLDWVSGQPVSLTPELAHALGAEEGSDVRLVAMS